MKVKAKVTIVENGVRHYPGDIFSISKERAIALGDSIRILKIKEKSEPEPPSDKAIDSPEKNK